MTHKKKKKALDSLSMVTSVCRMLKKKIFFCSLLCIEIPPEYTAFLREAKNSLIMVHVCFYVACRWIAVLSSFTDVCGLSVRRSL